MKIKKCFFPTLLLVLHAFLLLSFAANNFFTVDEPIGIAGGISILRNNNYSVNPENGIVGQILSALPLNGIVHQINIDYQGPNRFLPGQQLLFQDSISPEKLLFLSRSCMCLLSLLCGWLVYRLAKSCCGYRAGIFALSIYVFFPIVLANGCLATSDMALSCTLFLFLCLFMRLLRRITIGRFFAASAALILAVLSKMSALIIIVYMPVPILLTLWLHPVLKIQLGKIDKKIKDWRVRLGIYALICILMGGLLLAGIWTAYSFQNQSWQWSTEKSFSYYLNCPNFTAVVMKNTGLHKIFPKPYTLGLLYVTENLQHHYAWLDGEFLKERHFGHALKMLWYKLTPPYMCFSLLSLGIIFSQLASRRKRFRAGFFRYLPYGIFALLYVIMFLFSKNAGLRERYILPSIVLIFPAFAFVWQTFERSENKKLMLALLYALSLWNIGECLSFSPHYLSYFNPLAGNREKAYLHITDASLDWGQDLLNLRKELIKRNIPPDGSIPVYFHYFGSVPWKIFPFAGDRVIDLRFQSDFLTDLKPGYYIFSASSLVKALQDPSIDLILKTPGFLPIARQYYFDRLNAKKSGVPCRNHSLDKISPKILYDYQRIRVEFLRQALWQREPVFTINGSIIVFQVDETFLKEVNARQ